MICLFRCFEGKQANEIVYLYFVASKFTITQLQKFLVLVDVIKICCCLSPDMYISKQPTKTPHIDICKMKVSAAAAVVTGEEEM